MYSSTKGCFKNRAFILSNTKKKKPKDQVPGLKTVPANEYIKQRECQKKSQSMLENLDKEICETSLKVLILAFHVLIECTTGLDLLIFFWDDPSSKQILRSIICICEMLLIATGDNFDYSLSDNCA